MNWTCSCARTARMDSARCWSPKRTTRREGPGGRPAIRWEEHTFVHQLQRFLGAVAGQSPIAPDGATFEDGYRCAVICDALDRAAREARRVTVDGPVTPERTA